MFPETLNTILLRYVPKINSWLKVTHLIFSCSPFYKCLCGAESTDEFVVIINNEL